MDVHGYHVILGGMYVDLNEMTAYDSYLSSNFIDLINQIIVNYLTPNMSRFALIARAADIRYIMV